MLRSTSKITSLALLLLFLFPQVHKGIHDFEHRNDFHCDAKAETHLHSHEHYCKICDFSISGGIETQLCEYNLIEVVNEFSFSPGQLQSFSVSFWRSLPPRAPPVFFS